MPKRKSPDEWRAINRSAKVKDGRPLLLAVPSPRKAGELLVIEAWWCVKTRAWWAANCTAGLPGCDLIVDTFGEPTMWRPMPSPPVHHDVRMARSTKQKKAIKSAANPVSSRAARGGNSVHHAAAT